MRPYLLSLLLATAASGQIAVTGDVSVGPSLTSLGASGEIVAAGIPVPLGRVEFPTAVGLDARARLEVHGRVWGGRVGAGLLTASTVADGAALLIDQRSLDVSFAVASGEVTYRQPYGSGVVVAGLGPELRVVVDEGDPDQGIRQLLGDVRQTHLAVGASLGGRFEVGGVTLGPELRGGLSLTPLADDAVTALGGAIRLAGDFRFNHVSLSLTVGLR